MSFRKSKQNTVRGVLSWCYECEKEDRRRAYREKQDWLMYFKLDSGCVECGNSIHHAMLSFHHIVDKSDWMKRGQMLAHKSWDKIYSELEKCVVLCHNCHAIAHYTEVI